MSWFSRPGFGFHAVSFVIVVFSLSLAGSVLGAGEVDQTFNASAYADLNLRGNLSVVKVLPDGKILIGGDFTEINGYAASGVARLNADGTTDTSFNCPDFYNNFGIGSNIYALAVQSDGKILVGGQIFGAGDTKNGIRRLNTDGTIDASFTIVEMQFGGTVYDIEVQSDGKILVAGLFFLNVPPPQPGNLVRLNANGTHDTSFTPSVSGLTFKDVAMTSDGKILAGGSSTSTTVALLRFESNGATDSSFTAIQSGNGPIESVALQSDGKAIVGGGFSTLNGFTQGRVSRVNTDGSLDLTFNLNLIGANADVKDVVIQPDGKAIIVGAFSTFNTTVRQRIARLNTDGFLDPTFVPTATITNTLANEVELLPDGRVLVGTNTSSLHESFLRFAADGAYDISYIVQVNKFGLVNEVLERPDGKILVAGQFARANTRPRLSLALFNADGSLDTTFTPYFNNLTFLPNLQAIAVQPDGKILVGGLNGVILKRLNSDGSEDTSFVTPGGLTGVYDVAVLPGGQVIAVGTFGIRRYLSNGTLDATFTIPALNSEVYRVIVQADGKLMICGAFTQIGASIRGRIARLNSDGTLDNTFNPPGGANANVLAIDVQTDGKVVLGGNYSALNGNGNIRTIGRLNADGTLDSSFVQSTNAAVLAVKVQADGKILIGGSFSAIGSGIPRNGIARLNSDASLDAGFTPVANRSVNDIKLQADGKILLGGQFTKINGTGRVRLARLLNAAAPIRPLFDYDGDSKADVSVFRSSENRWYIFRSSDSAITQMQFAIAGDIPVPADYDGDLKTDIAIYRPSNGAWWYLSSMNGAQINVNWGGEAGDIPRPSDFDGDGKTDFVFFRPTNSTWYRINSTGTMSNVQFGLAGDKPVRGDFDGDGKSDVAIYRPSTGDWWYQSSINNAQLAVRWGISTDIPAPADFDGDGKTDFAVYRPSTGVWYVINSSNGTFLIGPFGIAEDKPVPADYDGDGKAELAVFRPSTGVWYQLRTNGGFFAMQFGVGTDVPTPNAFVP